MSIFFSLCFVACIFEVIIAYLEYLRTKNTAKLFFAMPAFAIFAFVFITLLTLDINGTKLDLLIHTLLVIGALLWLADDTTYFFQRVRIKAR